MIEESARIISRDGEYAWVETQRKSACGACSARSGCGTSALSKVVGQRAVRVRVLNTVDAQVGEQVMIGLDDAALVRGSLAVYLVPLLGLLAGALLGEMAGEASRELSSMMGGIAGLLVGFLWLRRYSARAVKGRQYEAWTLSRGDPDGEVRTITVNQFKNDK